MQTNDPTTKALDKLIAAKDLVEEARGLLSGEDQIEADNIVGEIGRLEFEIEGTDV